MATFEIKNAPADVSLVDFYATLNKYDGVAKANRFIVSISLGRNSFLSQMFSGSGQIVQDLQLLCEAAELPARTIVTHDVTIYGPTVKFRVESAYTELNLTFICRSEMFEKQFFDQWQNYVNPINNYDFRYKKEYSTLIDIFQLTETEGFREGNEKFPRPVYKVTLENAYPINVNPIQMVWAEDNFHRVQVSFAYDRWYRHTNELA